MRKLKPIEVASLLCTAASIFHIGTSHAQFHEITIHPDPQEELGGLYFTDPGSPSNLPLDLNLTPSDQACIKTIDCIMAYLNSQKSAGSGSAASDASTPYISGNSDTYTSTRNANPDNLSCVPNPTTKKWELQPVEIQYGATGCEGGTSTLIAVFPNMADGINAALASLKNYASSNSTATIASWINTWAPPSNNNTNALSTIEGDLATVFWQNDQYFNTAAFTMSQGMTAVGNENISSFLQYPSLLTELLAAFAQDEGFRKNSNECG